MPVKVNELIAMIEADGWFRVRQKGSHRQYHHATKPGTVTVAGKTEHRGSTRNVERAQAGGTEEVRAAVQYLVVIESGPTSYGAYVPDLPGCVAVGATREEVTTLIHEAIEFHIEGMKEDGQPISEPSSSSARIEVNT